MAKKDGKTNEGSGWLSRKLLLAAGVFIAGIGFAVYMCVVGEYGLALAALGIAGGAVGVYNGANAYLSSKYSNHGFPPGMEP